MCEAEKTIQCSRWEGGGRKGRRFKKKRVGDIFAMIGDAQQNSYDRYEISDSFLFPLIPFVVSMRKVASKKISRFRGIASKIASKEK